MLLCLTACGEAAQKTADAVGALADAVSAKVDAAVSAASSYVEGPQLQMREAHCKAEGGTWVARIDVSPCAQGVATLTIDGKPEQQSCTSGSGGDNTDQCLHRDAQGRAYFNDGPSMPPILQKLSGISTSYDLGRWGTLFWDAAVNHDYCYHHNGSTRGLSKDDCDAQMLQDLAAVCAVPSFTRIAWFDRDTCRKNAALSYAAVRGCGSDFFDVQNTVVDYPAWRPLREQYGVAESELDVAPIIEAVDDALDTFNPCG